MYSQAAPTAVSRIMLWAVLPLKDFVFAKQRLATVLTSPERQHFFQAMVEDVLTVLKSIPTIDRILIVSDDDTATEMAQSYGVEIIGEDRAFGCGLNSAVATAANHIKQQKGDSMLVVHGDMPMVNKTEFQQLLDFDVKNSDSKKRIVIVPDREGQGTNVMLCSPPDVIDFFYGPGSCQKHLQAATRQGAQQATMSLPGLGLDIDTPEDIQSLLAEISDNADARHSTAFLVKAGYVTGDDIENKSCSLGHRRVECS